MIAAAVVLAASVGGMVGLTSLGLAPLLIVATALVLAIPVMRRVVGRSFDIFEPVNLFTLVYGVMFVVRPAAELARGDLFYAISGYGISIRPTFTLTVAVGLTGALAFVTAYETGLGARLAVGLPPPGGTLVRSRAAAAALLVGAIGLAGSVGYIAALGTGGLDLLFAGRSAQLEVQATDSVKYFYNAALLLIPSALVLFAVALSSRSWWLYAACAAAVGLVVAIKGPTRSRITLLPMVAGLVLVYYLYAGRRPRVITAVVALGVAVVASHAILEFRQVDRPMSTSDSDNGAAFLEPILNGQDAAMAPALAAMLTVVPDQISYQYGSATVVDLLTRPVPRALWRGKPEPPRERVMNTLWPGLLRARVANPEFSGLGIFYLDFGVPGVLLGFGLYGVGARVLYTYLKRYESIATAQVLFAATLPFLVIALRDSFVDTVARTTLVVLPLVLILRFASKPSASPRRAPPSLSHASH